MTKGYPVQVLKPSVELHNKDGCPLCNEPQNEQGSYSKVSMDHVLNLFAAEGKLLKILMDDGGIAWQEPEPFYKEHPEFKGETSHDRESKMWQSLPFRGEGVY